MGYIDRATATAVISKKLGVPFAIVAEALESVEDADVKQNIYGEWKQDGALYRCTACGETAPYDDQKFCPECGAIMRNAEKRPASQAEDDGEGWSFF